MKTSIAHSWKSLASKFHPPLPLSPRESQRLLSLLNSSFKQKLDREHLADSKSNEHYANLHLQSVLTNPLFDPKSQTRIDLKKNQSHGKRLEQLQDHVERPMDAFKERVSQGIADLGTAKFFLHMQYNDCLASPAATRREAMQSSGAASTILQWLWSSGVEDTGSFLTDHEFIVCLVPFLVADGQHSRILHWLQRCYSPKTPFSNLPRLGTNRLPRLLFEKMIAAEVLFGGGMESAITLYTRTIGDFRSFGSIKSSMRNCAGYAAWALTKAIIGSKAAEPDPGIVQCFIETTREFTYDSFLYAYLCVHVQKPPNLHPALRYFQNTSSRAILEMKHRRQHGVILLGLNAAELFFQDSRQTEAFWIMDFLERTFAQELGSANWEIRRKRLDPVEVLRKKEEQSLHLLDTLTA